MTECIVFASCRPKVAQKSAALRSRAARSHPRRRAACLARRLVRPSAGYGLKTRKPPGCELKPRPAKKASGLRRLKARARGPGCSQPRDEAPRASVRRRKQPFSSAGRFLRRFLPAQKAPRIRSPQASCWPCLQPKKRFQFVLGSQSRQPVATAGGGLLASPEGSLALLRWLRSENAKTS